MTWRSENSCRYLDSNCDFSVVQPIASRYTDCAIPEVEEGMEEKIKSTEKEKDGGMKELKK
jgi:hypothetical protein